MDKNYAIKLIQDVFQNPFNREQFIAFTKNLFNFLDTKKTPVYRGNLIPDAYETYIRSLERIGKYEDAEGNKIDVLIVHLKKERSIEHARSMQRNFIAWYLSGSRGGQLKDAALVAFHTDNPDDWRFSLVKMDYQIVESETGKIKTKTELTPARRFSFLVGKNENSHTAQRQLLPILQDDKNNPLLSDLEKAFNIEVVTHEFFERYCGLFLNVKEALEKIIVKNPAISQDFTNKGVDPVDFSKKLLGQIVFLYFLQKKGWFGVGRDDNWGTGPKNFLRLLFEKMIADYKNFFNDILEPLFYEALAKERDKDFYSRFNCKIPFLNGGLFDPISDYDWVHTDILLPDDLFSNHLKTKEGDIGTGILDIFDRYNFTVKEDEPLEKEVAVDPEMLGKVFENLLEVKDRKSKGTYYTPREIVHYMCQESLINYLINECEDKVNRKDIEILIQYGESAVEHDGRVEQEGKETETYSYKLPESIRKNAQLIDDKLKNIRVCDPAIGSGAFPVGMMNEIIRTRNTLTNYLEDKGDRSIYSFKRNAIQNSLYGVDIDPGAVEIAKLRLWLSLVVDEEDIKQIKPLPNLDYKIMQGNSLLEEFEGVQLFDEELISKPALDDDKYKDEIKEQIAKLQREYIQLHSTNKLTAVKKGELEFELKKQNDLLKRLSKPEKFRSENTGQFDMFSEVNKKAQKLKQLHKEFFEVSQKTKKDELKKRIEDLEWELIETTLKEQNKVSALKQLEQYKKSNIKPFFLWKLHFSEVFQEKGGFDVVIANPPYIGDKNHKSIFRPIINTEFGKRYYKGQMDLFYFFFHLALNLGNKNSQIAFITTNYYLTASGARKLREDFKKRAIVKKLTNFNELKIFKSATGQHNMVSILVKGQDAMSKTNNSITNQIGDATSAILESIVGGRNKDTNYFEVSQKDLYDGDESYIRLVGTSELNPINRILNKIKENNPRLGEDNLCKINAGIGVTIGTIDNKYIKKYPMLNLTPHQGVFVVGNDISKYLENTKIKDFIKNSDISHYRYKKNPSKLIYITRYDDIDNYPKIKAHLKQFKNILDDQIVGYEEKFPWYALNRPRTANIFEDKNKIVCPYRARKNYFAYSDESIYGSRDVLFIRENDSTIKIKYVLSLLNSKLYYYWLYYRGKKKGEILELVEKPLSEIPIKKISENEQKPFIELADMILTITNLSDYLANSEKQMKVKDYENQIDELVYKLYGLTPEEISLIEGRSENN